MADVSYRFAGIPYGVVAKVWSVAANGTRTDLSTNITGTINGYADATLPVGDYIATFSNLGEAHEVSGDLASRSDTDVADSTADAATAAAAVKGLPLALTGATQPTRYVGRWAATGAPASGTFAVGDFGFDGANTVQLCTEAGTPGTWISASGTSDASDVAYDNTASSLTATDVQAAIDELADSAPGGAAITRTTIPITPATADRAILVDAIPARSVMVGFALSATSADTTTRDNIDVSFQKDDGSGDEGAAIAYASTDLNGLDTSFAPASKDGTEFMGSSTWRLPLVVANATKIRLYRYDTGGEPGDGEYEFTVDWIPGAS